MKKKVSVYGKLAEERTLLSNERTLLSYVRTALTAIVLGFALIQFSVFSHYSTNGGYIAIVAGLIILAVGLTHFKILKKKIHTEVGDE